MRGVVTFGGKTEPPLVPDPPAPAVAPPVLLAAAVVLLAVALLAVAPPVLVVFGVAVVLLTEVPSVLLELVPPVLLATLVVVLPDVGEPCVVLELLLEVVAVDVACVVSASNPEHASMLAHASTTPVLDARCARTSLHGDVGFNALAAESTALLSACRVAMLGVIAWLASPYARKLLARRTAHRTGTPPGAQEGWQARSAGCRVRPSCSVLAKSNQKKISAFTWRR